MPWHRVGLCQNSVAMTAKPASNLELLERLEWVSFLLGFGWEAFFADSQLLFSVCKVGLGKVRERQEA